MPIPALSYGRTPEPGSIVCTLESDQTLTIEIVPKSLAQIAISLSWAAVAFIPLLVAGYIVHRYARVTLDLVVPVVFIFSMGIPAAIFAVYTCSRQEMRIIASSEGLSIWTREFGDDVTHDFPRAQIVWVDFVRCPENSEGPTLGLFIQLRGKHRWFQIHRRAAELKPLGAQLRQALNIPASPHSKFAI
jgi:hypothetical protein